MMPLYIPDNYKTLFIILQHAPFALLNGLPEGAGSSLTRGHVVVALDRPPLATEGGDPGITYLSPAGVLRFGVGGPPHVGKRCCRASADNLIGSAIPHVEGVGSRHSVAVQAVGDHKPRVCRRVGAVALGAGKLVILLRKDTIGVQ